MEKCFESRLAQDDTTTLSLPALNALVLHMEAGNAPEAFDWDAVRTNSVSIFILSTSDYDSWQVIPSEKLEWHIY